MIELGIIYDKVVQVQTWEFLNHQLNQNLELAGEGKFNYISLTLSFTYELEILERPTSRNQFELGRKQHCRGLNLGHPEAICSDTILNPA